MGSLQNKAVLGESGSASFVAPAHQYHPPCSPQQQSLASLSGPPVEANRVEISDSVATCAVSLSTYTPGCF